MYPASSSVFISSLSCSTDWYSSSPSRSLTFWLSMASISSRRRASLNWSSRPSICCRRFIIRMASLSGMDSLPRKGKRVRICSMGARVSRFCASSIISHELFHEILQFLALLRREILHNALHRRLLHLHLLDQIVQRVHAWEVLAVLLHEGVEVGLAALLALAQHLIEVTDHLTQLRDILGGHILQRLLHALEELLHHLLLQALHQFVELLAGLLVHEVILGETLDLAGNILGKLVQVVLLALRNHLQHTLLLLGRETIVPALIRLPLLV